MAILKDISTFRKKLKVNAARLDRDKILFEMWQDPFVQNFIIDLNHEQLLNGLNGDGEILGFYASNEYARFKARRASYKAPFGVVDLFLNGDFFNTFRVLPNNRGFVLDAITDLHGWDMEQRYGTQIVKLSNESLQKLIDFARPIFIGRAIQQLLEG